MHSSQEGQNSECVGKLGKTVLSTIHIYKTKAYRYSLTLVTFFFRNSITTSVSNKSVIVN